MATLTFNIIPASKNYQFLEIIICGSGLMKPEDLKELELPESVDYTGGIILSAKAPVWLFAYLTHKLKKAKWVATYDPRAGAVVVQANSPDSPQAGDIIPNEELLKYIKQPEVINKKINKVTSEKKIIALVGPPHSGKSVLLYYLKKELQVLMGIEIFQRDFFIIRACPDGEGDWFGEVLEDIGRVIRYKRGFDEEFIDDTVKFIRNSSKMKKLLLVDCGGKIDKTNQKILNECSHAIIVSRDEIETREWIGVLKLCDVELLSEIKSVPFNVSEKIDEMTFKIGYLDRGEKKVILPDELIRLILKV